MTETLTPGTTTSRPPPHSASASTRSPPEPQPTEGTALQSRLSGLRTTLIAGLAAATVAVIFIIQNVHAANISFLGIHLVLPLAGALLLAAIAGSLLTVVAGPARISRLRQIMRHGLATARWANKPPVTPPSPLAQATTGGPETPAAFVPRDSARPAPTTAYPAHVTD